MLHYERNSELNKDEINARYLSIGGCDTRNLALDMNNRPESPELKRLLPVYYAQKSEKRKKKVISKNIHENDPEARE